MKNSPRLMVSIIPVLVLAVFLALQPPRNLARPAISRIAYTSIDETQVFAARIKNVHASIGIGDLRRFESQASSSFLKALTSRQSVGMGELRRFESKNTTPLSVKSVSHTMVGR